METLFHACLITCRVKDKYRLTNIKYFSKLISAVSCLLLGLMQTSVLALTLDEAERLALAKDPLIESHYAVARAWNQDAVADNQLPDPQLRFGLSNVPLDTYSLSQEPMTQMIVGFQQMFPKGDSLELKQQQSEWNANMEKARAEDARLQLQRDVRETFLSLYYQVEAGRIIDSSRKLFAQLVDITEAQYASGRVNQQDVLRAELELSRLDDRAITIRGKEEEYRAMLMQWLGDNALQPVSTEFPPLPDVSDAADIDTRITQHPAIRIETAKIEASKKSAEISRQQYKPGWGLGLEYRKRFGENPDNSDRVDMMAAIVSIDVPLFAENRQDKRVAASEEKTSAARFARDDRLRKLRQVFDSNRAKLKRLNERHHKYETELIRAASSNAKAALKAYQSGVTEFTNLMRAHITELDIRLSDLRVRVDRALAKAQLIYVVGEES